MGRQTKEGESPVNEIFNLANSIQSSTEHEKFGVNKGGPSSKPKYYLMTDSEAVP